MTRALRISQVGVRGVVGPGLTAAHVVEFVAAFAAFLRERGAVVVARDPRASGLMIREVTVATLMASGRDVIDLGIAPTPVLQHTITRRRAAGGISIGASHNAPEWNALKFFGSQGRYLSTAEANELLDFYHLGRSCYVGHEALGSLTDEVGALDAYLDRLGEAFDLEALRQLPVVVDCCNGTSALVLERLGDRHGFRPVLLNERLEGIAFAHEPSTTARTVALQLAPVVVPLKAAAGFLFDADSDRVAIADDRGRPLSEELVLPLVADYLLPRERGRTVITNLSSTSLVDDVVRAHGGRLMRVPVGRQAAADALASLAPDTVALAGEGTGAVMMPRFNFAYDGIASMLAVLSLVVEGGRTLADIVDSYPRYEMLKGEVPLAASRMPAVLARLRERYATGPERGTAAVVDGLRVDWPDRWFHVRVSQTEPVVRVITEQRGGSAHALHAALLEEVRRG